MNEQEIREAVVKIKEIYKDLDDEQELAKRLCSDGRYLNSLNWLLSLAQQYLDIKGMPEDFEYFLTEKHAEQYIGTKDCMVDDFEKWIQELEIDDFIKYGNKALHLCKLARMKQSQQGLMGVEELEATVQNALEKIGYRR